MKQFNLQEYLANPSRQVVTREGREVRIICTDFDNPDYPVIGEINCFKWPCSFTTNGLLIKDGDEHPCDLFFAPTKHEGWINLPALTPEEQGDRPHPFKIPVFEREAKARMARENIERFRVKIEDNALYYSVKRMGGISMKQFNFKTVTQIWDDYKVIFVFSDDGRVSCRLSFYNDAPQEAFISDLYVHESIRKQSCATSILNWCYECAKDCGCNSISLQSDNDDWVRQWYMRLGFKVKSSQVWLTKTI